MPSVSLNNIDATLNPLIIIECCNVTLIASKIKIYVGEQDAIDAIISS